MYILLFLLFVTGDHCSCFSDVRFQPDTAIFKSDGSDVYAYILCTWWSGVATTKTRFKLPIVNEIFFPKIEILSLLHKLVLKFILRFIFGVYM